MKILLKGLIFKICFFISFSLFIFYSQNLCIHNKDTSFKVIKDMKRIESDTDLKNSTFFTNQLKYQSNEKEEFAKVSIFLFGNFDRLEELMKDYSNLVVMGTVKSTEPYIIMKNGGIEKQ
ncbi:hypothetical protein CN925_01335 [Bacillus sp. AFS055030]|nr:hypothetical protein CN925_01335 [Bacillus sp. AFS055030]